MTSESDSSTQWNRFIPYLDGRFYESFALNWGSGPYSASYAERQMTQATTWIQNGKHFVAIFMGECASGYCLGMNRSQLQNFSLGVYLLVNDGINASYCYNNYNAQYVYFYDFAETSYTL